VLALGKHRPEAAALAPLFRFRHRTGSRARGHRFGSGWTDGIVRIRDKSSRGEVSEDAPRIRRRRVVLTRDSDRALTLQDSRRCAAQVKRIFSSRSITTLRAKGCPEPGEIYFNALDEGIPLRVAEEMSSRFPKAAWEPFSVVLPGGYFVLRNNPAPAILTEASYISVPRDRKKTPKRKNAYRRGTGVPDRDPGDVVEDALKVQIYARTRFFVNTPYMNLLFAGERPVGN